MIPTSPSGSPRGGGEVGITEAERSDRVPAGKRGCQAGIAACITRVADAALYGGYTVARGRNERQSP